MLYARMVQGVLALHGSEPPRRRRRVFREQAALLNEDVSQRRQIQGNRDPQKAGADRVDRHALERLRIPESRISREGSSVALPLRRPPQKRDARRKRKM